MAGAAHADNLKPVSDVYKDCADCPEMVVIPAGEVEIGGTAEDIALTTPAAAAPEQPRHKVTLRSFAMGRTTVTRAQFSLFAAETGYKVVGTCGSFNLKTRVFEKHLETTWTDPGFKQTDRDPVVCVNMTDVAAYITWLTSKTKRVYRLPSEAEWEYAARAGTTSLRYWGDAEACQFANASDRSAVAFGAPASADVAFNCSDSFATTAPVGSFKPNRFGLADMLGNVSQWLADCLHPNYQDAPTDGSAWSGDEGCRRILRGGAWMSVPSDIRVARRSSDPPEARGNGLGFRVASESGSSPERKK